MAVPPLTGQSAPSPRVRLARLAWETALATKQIAAGVAGPRSQWATSYLGTLLPGVLAAARADGRYDVELHLIARWPVPPLHELASEIRERVVRAAEREALRESLGELSVFFGDLLGPEEG